VFELIESLFAMWSKFILLFYLCCHLDFVKTDSNTKPEMPKPIYSETGNSTEHQQEISILTQAEMDEIWELIPDTDDLDLILDDPELMDIVDEKITSDQIDDSTFDEISFDEFEILFEDQKNSSEGLNVCY